MGETPMLLSGRAAGFPAFDGLGVALAVPHNTVAMMAEQPHVVPCVAFAPPVQRLNMVNGWRLAVNMPKQITRISPQRCAAAQLANVPVSLEHGCRFDLRVEGNAIPQASATVARVRIAQVARRPRPPASPRSVARNRTVSTNPAAAVFFESDPARFAYLAYPSKIRRPPASRRTMHLWFACRSVYRKSKRLAAPAASQRRMLDRAFAVRLVAAATPTAVARLPARFTFLLVGRPGAAAAPTAFARLPARFTFSLLAACPRVPAAARLAPRGARPFIRQRE